MHATAEPSRRDLLLAAADRLVVHYGPQKTTVADIAREAGVAVGSVYLEFAGKSQILEALSEWRLTQVLADMESRLHQTAVPLADRVGDALEIRSRTLAAQAEAGKHADALLRCDCAGVAAAWQRFAAGTRELLVAALRGADPDGAEDLADAFLRLYAEYVPPALCRMPATDLARAFAVNRRLLHGALRPADRAPLG